MINFTVGPVQSSDAVRAVGAEQVPYWQGSPPRECLEAALNPAILHFWGPKKPWKVSHRPYRRLYHEAMRAVGQKPPKEPLLAPYYNLINSLNLWKARQRAALQRGG